MSIDNKIFTVYVEDYYQFILPVSYSDNSRCHKLRSNSLLNLSISVQINIGCCFINTYHLEKDRFYGMLETCAWDQKTAYIFSYFCLSQKCSD